MAVDTCPGFSVSPTPIVTVGIGIDWACTSEDRIQNTEYRIQKIRNREEKERIFFWLLTSDF